MKENRMNEYELQCVKNVEENRRIWESFRPFGINQEQVCRIRLKSYFISHNLNTSCGQQI